MVLRLPQGHEGSEYVLSFEIGQREGGFYSTRTDTPTDRHTEPPSSALVYRLCNIYFLHYFLRINCSLPSLNTNICVKTDSLSAAPNNCRRSHETGNIHETGMLDNKTLRNAA